MKKFLFLLFSLTIYSVNAQFEPRISVQNQQNEEENLKLSYLDVQIEINGNYALSTYTMKFYNGYDRTLEGELKFPLAEGQSVVDFAMDVNGTMREAVVVEKELGRVAYETTVRRRIDPALLEKTQGNNYKVRVYPILAKSMKLIKITVEEELKPIDNISKMNLAFDGKEAVDNFTMSIDVVGGELVEDRIKNKKLKFDTTRLKNHHIARLKRKNIPLSNINCTFYTKIAEYPIVNLSNIHFNITTQVGERTSTNKAPKEITVLWDASMSMQNRDLDKELGFLEGYFKLYPNLNVNLISFSNQIISKKKFSIKKGNWKALKENLSTIKYDGATNYKVLNDLDMAKNTLLFTDGLGSFEDYNPLKTDLVLVNSLKKSDYDAIHYLGGDAKDVYVNLRNTTIEQAIDKIEKQPMFFMGYTPNKDVYQVYHDLGITSGNQFAISGKLRRDTELELLFGDGEKVLEKQKILLEREAKNELSSRLWAKQKLKTLVRHKKNNKEKIINHAKEYKLISDYTSLIVLDRLEDYLKYKIDPPAELQEAYKRSIKGRVAQEEREEKRLEKRRTRVQNEAKEGIAKWYYKKQNVKEQPKKTPPITRPTQIERPVRANVQQSLNRNESFISGTVVDENNEPLIGVSISRKRDGRLTISDFDGNYSINVNVGDLLVFDYLGFSKKEIRIDNLSEKRIQLEKNSESLDEVVIVGYGTQRKTEVTGAVVRIEADDIVYADEVEISTALQGQVAGVHVTAANGQPGAASSVRIRGVSSVNVDRAVPLPPRKQNGNVRAASLKSWDPNTPYIKQLKKTTSVEESYALYFKLRIDYKDTPTFFLDVADYFIRKKDIKKGVRILTNLLEMDLNNYELLKAIAYKLDELKMYEMAVKVNKKIVELRSEDPQSYRDLGLAYQAVGNYQKAFDLLYRVYSGEFLKHDERHRFDGVEQISFVELSRLVSTHKKQLELSPKQQEEFKELPVDIRVVVDWNHNDTDLDLWVIDPNGEKCYYSNKKTKIGGRISNDMTSGFGPEEFLLKNAIKGDYTIKVKYYSDTKQKISGPTVLKLTMYTQYGTKKEVKEVQTYRLTSKSDVLEVGNVHF